MLIESEEARAPSLSDFWAKRILMQLSKDKK